MAGITLSLCFLLFPLYLAEEHVVNGECELTLIYSGQFYFLGYFILFFYISASMPYTFSPAFDN